MTASRNESRFVSVVSDRTIEALLFACIVLSPWAYGCTDAIYEFFLTCGVSAALLVFAVSVVAGECPRWKGGPMARWVVMGWGGVAIASASHLLMLRPAWIDRLAPGVAEWSQPLSSEPLEGLIWPSEELIASTTQWFAGSHLGLYAGGSFQFLVRIGLIVGLFVVVVCMRHPSPTLFRMSWIGTITGTALAIFGLAQHYGSHDQLIYWTREVEGGLGFGPFINRNHYPFFLNLSLGLAIGLLIRRLSALGRNWYRLLLEDPAVAWLLAAITFMLASLFVCGSRGGLLSALASISIVALLRMRTANVARGIFITSLVALPTMLVLTWVGFQIQQSRLTMLAETDRYTNDGRLNLWRSAWQSVPQFPWFGSGGETFQHWDTIHQSGDPDWNNWQQYSLRADNEWLDVLNEYGLIGMGSLLIVTVALIRVAVRVSQVDALGAGTAIGVLAVIMHSVVDFGLRVPATAVFATVVTGLMIMQDRRSHVDALITKSSKSAHSDRPRWKSVMEHGAWMAGSIVLVLIAFGSIHTKRRYFQAEQLEWAAYRSFTDNQFEDAVNKRLAATVILPEDLQTRLRLIRDLQICMEKTTNEEFAALCHRLILNHSVIASRVCPLAWQPYAWLAQYNLPGVHEDGDVRAVLLARARSLHSSEPDMAYLSGRLALDRGEKESAMDDWRDSLTYSTEHVPEIMLQAALIWTPTEIAESLLPADPVVLLEAVKTVKEQSELGQALLERASELLAQPDLIQRDLQAGESEELRARVLFAQSRTGDAIAMLNRAISLSPDRLLWRLQLVQWLMNEKDWEDATREVRIVLAMDKDNAQAKRLQQEVIAGKSALTD